MINNQPNTRKSLRFQVNIEKDLITFVQAAAKQSESKNMSRWVNDLIRRKKIELANRGISESEQN